MRARHLPRSCISPPLVPSASMGRGDEGARSSVHAATAQGAPHVCFSLLHFPFHVCGRRNGCVVSEVGGVARPGPALLETRGHFVADSAPWQRPRPRARDRCALGHSPPIPHGALYAASFTPLASPALCLCVVCVWVCVTEREDRRELSQSHKCGAVHEWSREARRRRGGGSRLLRLRERARGAPRSVPQHVTVVPPRHPLHTIPHRPTRRVRRRR